MEEKTHKTVNSDYNLGTQFTRGQAAGGSTVSETMDRKRGCEIMLLYLKPHPPPLITHCGELVRDKATFLKWWPYYSGYSEEQERPPGLSFDLSYQVNVPENGSESIDLPSKGREGSLSPNFDQNLLLSLNDLETSSLGIFDKEIYPSPIEMTDYREGDESLMSLCVDFEGEINAV